VRTDGLLALNLPRRLPWLNPPAATGLQLAGAPDAPSAGLLLGLTHLVDTLADLLLEREIPRALHRREKPGEFPLFLLLDVQPLTLGLRDLIEQRRHLRIVRPVGPGHLLSQRDAKLALLRDDVAAHLIVFLVRLLKFLHLLVGRAQSLLRDLSDAFLHLLLEIRARGGIWLRALRPKPGA
jgi:hypothetical protein